MVDFSAGLVLVDGREARLTATEFRLLENLARHRGQVRSRSDLLRDVFGYRPNSRTVSLRTHIGRLRRKLGNPCLVETVIGSGYRLYGQPGGTGRP